MDDFHNNPTSSSTSINPNFQVHGKNEDQPVTASNVNETQDVKEQTQLRKSPIYDSTTDDVNNSLVFDSSSPPYDPVNNYLSPRPKFLKYNPNRHRDILARQEELNRILETSSCDEELPVSQHSQDHDVQETEEIGDNEEHEDDTEEEEFDEFEDYDDKCSVKSLLQYLVVILVLILTTVAISSMNSPPREPTEFIYGFNISKVEGETCDPMMLISGYYEKRDHVDLKESSKELVDMPNEQMRDEFNEHETDETVSNQWQEPVKAVRPVVLLSEKRETYRVDSNSSDVNEEPQVLKQMVDENEVKGEENTSSVTKLVYLDPVFAAFGAIAFVIFASTSFLYYSMQTEISTPVGDNRDINEVCDESSSVGSFGSKSSIFLECDEGNKDASSSNQSKYFDFEQSTSDSPSHGSFTVEKKIVRKQRSKTPEAMISTVRRSTRIHNRSVSSPR